MIDLVNLLPQKHRGKNVRKLLGLTEEELRSVSDFVFTIGLQAGIDTSTYGLDDWEQMLNIPINPSATLQDRREVVKAKLRSHGQATKTMIQNAAEAFSGGEVEVIEHISDFRFTVKFVGVKGIPNNMDNFIETLEQIKPSHLEYDFEYTYTTWGQLKTKTWGDLKSETWGSLRVY